MAGTISILGMGSGLQLQDILDQLKAADSAPITRLKAKQLQAKDKVAELDTLKKLLLDLKDKALTLGLSSTYLGRSVSLSDSSSVSVSATSGASTGSYNIEVVRLAQYSAWRSASGFASKDSIINGTGSTETFTYEVNGKSTSLSVASGTTLQQLAALINDDPNNPGVTASVVKDGTGATPYKLLIQSNTLGESGRISITKQLTDITLAEETGTGGASLDAEIKIDGVSYTKGSNEITDILTGVTFTLQATGQTTLSITTDTSGIAALVKDFVTGLNEYFQEVNTNSSYDTDTGVGGSLYGVTSIQLFKSQVIESVSDKVDVSGSITSIFDLGFEFARDGTVSINEDTLNQALSEHFNDVKSFFLGDTDNNITGWADRVNTILRTATKANTGLIDAEKSAANSQINNLDEQITSAEARLEKKYEILARQFLELDRYMNNMQSISSYLSQQFEAFNNALKNK